MVYVLECKECECVMYVAYLTTPAHSSPLPLPQIDLTSATQSVSFHLCPAEVGMLIVILVSAVVSPSH